MRGLSSFLINFLLVLVLLNLIPFNASVPLPLIGGFSLNYVLLLLLVIQLFSTTIFNFKLSNGIYFYLFFFVFYIIYSSTLLFFFESNVSLAPLYVNSIVIILLIVVMFVDIYNKNIIQFYEYIQYALVILLVGNSITIYQYIFQLNWVITNIDELVILRAYGLYLNPNIAGYIAITSIIFSIYLMLFYKKHSVLNILIIVVAIVAGIMTFSKTFFINATLVFLIYLYYRGEYIKSQVVTKFFRRLKYLIFIPIIIFIYIAISTEGFLDEEQFNRLKTVFFFLSDTNVDYSGRSELVEFGLRKALENPFWGYGYGSFTILKDSNQLLDFTSVDLGVHNTFVRIWGEGGIITIVIYISFWIYLYLKMINKTLENKMLAIMLFVTLIIYSLTSHNIPEDYYSSFIIVLLCKLISSKEVIIISKINQD